MPSEAAGYGIDTRFTSGASGNDVEVEHPGAPSDNTTVQAVLTGFAEMGFTAELWSKPGGNILCGACHTTSPASAFDVKLQRRLEGASDPADEQLVIGAICPACGAKGVISLHYGPTADEDDADIVVALPR